MQYSTSIPGAAGGNREDLRDDITILEPQETPFTSLIEKRGAVAAMLVETLSDRFRPPRSSGFPEGMAGGKGNNQSYRRGRFGVYVHKSRDEWAVTREQKLIAGRGGVAGITNIEDHEKSRTVLQLKRDMEAVNCSDIETQDGAGGTADMKTRGAFKWITASGTSLSPTVSDDFRPPSACILAHGGTTPQLFTELQFNTVGKALQRVHGTKKNFMLVAGDNVVETIDNYTRVINRASATTPAAAEHYQTLHYNEEYTVSLMVNIYESSFWRVDIVCTQFNKIDADGVGNANAALALFTDLWYLDMLEDLNEAEYWENSGGCGGVYQASWALVCKSPRGNGKFVTS